MAETLTSPADSSPQAPETPQGIDPNARTQYSKPSYTEHLNRRPATEPAGADASQASGGVDASGDGASADPAAFDPRTAPQGAAEGNAAGTPADTSADPYASTDNLPWNKDPRFQQFLADRKALQEQQAALAAPPAPPATPAQPAAEDPFAPLTQQLRDAGFSSYAEFERFQQERAEAAEDAQYEATLRQQAEERFYDEDVQEQFVQFQMDARLARREAEQARRDADQSRQFYEATLSQQAEQQRMRAFTGALSQFPILKTFAANAAGEGIGQRTLVELARSGNYSPEQITQAAASLASDYQAAIDAAVAAAKTEAAKDLKKSASAPATTGTRGQPGGTAPATGANGLDNPPPGVGFANTIGRFTAHLNRRNV